MLNVVARRSTPPSVAPNCTCAPSYRAASTDMKMT